MTMKMSKVVIMSYSKRPKLRRLKQRVWPNERSWKIYNLEFGVNGIEVLCRNTCKPTERLFLKKITLVIVRSTEFLKYSKIKYSIMNVIFKLRFFLSALHSPPNFSPPSSSEISNGQHMYVTSTPKTTEGKKNKTKVVFGIPGYI